MSIILGLLIWLIEKWNPRLSENYGMEAIWYAFY